MTTQTSAPIGSTGQSLEGVAVNTGAGSDLFRESVVLSDPSVSDAYASVVSTQPINFYGLPVWLQGTPTVQISSAIQITPTGTTQVFGTVSSQIVSSIPFFVAQSSAPWTMNGGVSVTNTPTVNVTNVPLVTVQGTSSVNVLNSPTVTVQGTSSVQVLNNVNVQGTSSVNVLGTTMVSVVSTVIQNIQGTSSVNVLNNVTVQGTSSVNVLNVPTVNVTNVPLVTVQGTSSVNVLNNITIQGTSSVNVLGTTQVFIVSTVSQNIQGTSSANILGGQINVSSFTAQPIATVPTASTAGGLLSLVIRSQANLNTTVAKASPGQVYGYALSNFGSTAVWFKAFNASSGTAQISSAPNPITIGVQVSTTIIQSMEMGVAFSTGIFCAVTGKEDTNDATSTQASTFVATLFYK